MGGIHTQETLQHGCKWEGTRFFPFLAFFRRGSFFQTDQRLVSPLFDCIISLLHLWKSFLKRGKSSARCERLLSVSGFR